MTDATPDFGPEGRRNARRYPWYVALFNAYFWLPVFFLYFSQELALREVLLLEAIYYFTVVGLELPSGFFSDVVGRRATLLISALSLVAAHTLFLVGSGFAAYAVGQLGLAVAMAFNSGTDTALHYDSLSAAGIEDEYEAREARAVRGSFLATAAAGLAGGLVGVLSLRAAYGLSLVAAVATCAVVLSFREPPRPAETARIGVVTQARLCLRYLREAPLGWLFGFAVLMTVLNHVPYELYQPYLDLIGASYGLAHEMTPALAGLHLAVTMVAGAFVAGRSARIRQQIGLTRTLLYATGLQIAIIAVMGLWLHPVAVLLVALRSTPRALMAAPLNAAVTPRIAQGQRASYLSIQSLAGRLAFGLALSGFALVSGQGAYTWSAIAELARISAALGAAGLLAMALTARRARVG